MKSACVIQGNVRQGLSQVITECEKHFDLIVLSTWNEDKNNAPPGGYELVSSARPNNPGLGNRNLQRLSTSVGIDCAVALGATHILKWRTDILPTRLSLPDLYRWSSHAVPAGVSSRLVMTAFRNLSVTPDWFSSFPDLFAFGEASMMRQLWGREGFDFSKPFNLPPPMLKECEISIEDFSDKFPVLKYRGKLFRVADLFDAHEELYAWFKYRVQEQLGLPLTHSEIATKYLNLIDHTKLGICWFRSKGKRRFRAVAEGNHVPWWTENAWRSGSAKTYDAESGAQKMKRKQTLAERLRSLFLREAQTALQEWWYFKYRMLGHR